MIETNDEIERQKMELDDGESSDSAIEEEDNVIEIARALASNTLKERNIVMGFAKIWFGVSEVLAILDTT